MPPGGPRPRGRGRGGRRDGELPGPGPGAGAGGLHRGGAEDGGLPGLRDAGQVGAEPAVQGVLRGGEGRGQGRRRRGLPLRRLHLQDDTALPDQRHPRLPPPRRLRRRRLRLQQVPRSVTHLLPLEFLHPNCLEFQILLYFHHQTVPKIMF